MQVRKLLIGVAIAATAVLSACSSQQPQAIGLAAGQQTGPTAAETSATPPNTPATTAQTSASPAPPSTSKTTPKTTPDKPKTTTDKPVAPPPPAPSGAPCSAAAKACIRLSTNETWLMDNGQVVYGPVKITSGRAGHLTPTGTFHVLSKVKDYHSREFDNAPMPYSVFFVPGIAFHQGSLSVKSHGCIHLSLASAQKYFATLSVGDQVEVVR